MNRWTNVSWSEPKERPIEPLDVCDIRIYFYGQHKPWTCPLVLNGRVVKDVFIGERHYIYDKQEDGDEE